MNPKATAGITRCRQSPRPDAGSQRRSLAKIRIRIRASQNPGMETPTRARKRPMLSNREFRFTAERTPTGMAMAMATNMAAARSSRVAGIRSSRSAMMGRPSWYEVPKSPRITLPSQVVYCSHTGLSRPSFFSRMAICSGLASSPQIMRAGPPGIMCPRAKTITLMPRSTTTLCNSRRRRYRVMMGRLLGEAAPSRGRLQHRTSVGPSRTVATLPAMRWRGSADGCRGCR